MASANWGTKRRCATCGAAFYDLNRDPIICPKCHSAYVAAPRVPLRGGSRSRVVEHIPDAAEASAFDEDEVLEHSDGDEDESGITRDSDSDGEDEELRE